jgi:hypothetical protein
MFALEYEVDTRETARALQAVLVSVRRKAELKSKCAESGMVSQPRHHLARPRFVFPHVIKTTTKTTKYDISLSDTYLCVYLEFNATL